MKKNTVTIGIPAFNEEANIKNLLQNLLMQKTNNFVLEKILVVSDNSTDNTNSIVRSFQNKKVQIIENKKRKGKPFSQNLLYANTKSDLLIILDADLLPADYMFLEHLLAPLLKDTSIGMVGGDTIPAKPRTFIESILADSHIFKTDIYKHMRRGNNLYMCHGRVRGLAKAFYSQLRIPTDCLGDDAFSYLDCLKNGFKFVYSPKAKIYFSSPSTLIDHAKQSTRFTKGNMDLLKYFDKKTIEKEFHLSFYLMLRSLIIFLFTNPVSAASYVFIQLFIKIFKPVKKVKKGAWNVSISTKKLLLYEKQ